MAQGQLGEVFLELSEILWHDLRIVLMKVILFFWR